MIGTDAKNWCQLEGATAGVGWWWSAVGGVMAGSDGAISDDGECRWSRSLGDWTKLTCTDSDTNPYPKRFLLLGMLLFKDILPILAHDHPDSESTVYYSSSPQSSLPSSSSPHSTC